MSTYHWCTIVPFLIQLLLLNIDSENFCHCLLKTFSEKLDRKYHKIHSILSHSVSNYRYCKRFLEKEGKVMEIAALLIAENQYNKFHILYPPGNTLDTF